MTQNQSLELFVARHGEYNRAMRNGPLTEEGYHKALLKAAEFAAQLHNTNPEEKRANHADRTTILYAPSDRTTITAEIFAAALGVTPDRMARLAVLDEDVSERVCPTREQLLERICDFIGPNVTRTLVVAHLGEVTSLAELDKSPALNTYLQGPDYAQVYPVNLSSEGSPSPRF